MLLNYVFHSNYRIENTHLHQKSSYLTMAGCVCVFACIAVHKVEFVYAFDVITFEFVNRIVACSAMLMLTFQNRLATSQNHTDKGGEEEEGEKPFDHNLGRLCCFRIVYFGSNE